MALTSRLLGSVADTTDGTGAKTTGAFTPTMGERIYLIQCLSNTSDASGFSLPISAGQVLGTSSTVWPSKSAAGTVRNQRVVEAHFTALARSMTVTVTPGTSITGLVMAAIGVAGYPKVRQVKTTERSAAAAAAPTVTFDQAVQAGSCVIAVARIGVATNTGLTNPTGSTQLYDGGHASPAQSAQVVKWDNGAFGTGTTVTWGSTTTSDWTITAIELEPAEMDEMSHYIQYGADSTHNVGRIQYPTADPLGIDDGGASYPFWVSWPSNQWGSSLDTHPNDNVLTEARAQGCATCFMSYREQPAAVWPAQANDAHAAVQWLIANAATYKLDLDRSRPGQFGISAGAQMAAIAALTGGKASVGGTNTPADWCAGVYWQFGHNGRARAMAPFMTAQGITWTRSPLPCVAGSVEATMLGTQPCALASFDWLAADSGSLSTSESDPYNSFSVSFWASRFVGQRKPAFNLWHGKADGEIPFCSTSNPKDAGSGHALDNGFAEDLVAAGFEVTTTLLVGEGHGGDAFQPSLNGSATNGAAVDAAVQWMIARMMAVPLRSQAAFQAGFQSLSGGL